jgi:hypothetical protein
MSAPNQGHRIVVAGGLLGNRFNPITLVTADPLSSSWHGRVAPTPPLRHHKGRERLYRRDCIRRLQLKRHRPSDLLRKPTLLKNARKTVSPQNGVTARTVSLNSTFFPRRITLISASTVSSLLSQLISHLKLTSVQNNAP